MTNAYAMQNDAILKPTYSSVIRQLFGLHMYMGCKKLPMLHFYWSPRLGPEKFQRITVIGRRCFCQLRNNLHIVNNPERPSACKHKIYKARPLLDCIRSRCQQLSVEQNIAIDEQMIPFKGMHSLKQYSPSKPYPWEELTVIHLTNRFRDKNFNLNGSNYIYYYLIRLLLSNYC
jgi:hypothetical protein